jgi:Pyruvate/2-oxoacid:ferredoxin oxidoreductase gamma subunit
VVVLDDSLLQVGGATTGVRPGGMLIINTTQPVADLGISGDFTVVTADVTGAAQAVDLIVGGQPMVSTAILGSFAAATGLIDLDSVERAIGYVFSGKAAAKNIEAARIAFECTH